MLLSKCVQIFLLSESKGCFKRSLFFFVSKANVGNMDCAKRQWKLIGGNLALIQVCLSVKQLLVPSLFCLWPTGVFHTLDENMAVGPDWVTQ